MRGCMDCGGKVAPNVRRCRDCVRKKRAEVDYRALALKAYGHDCAYCPKWLNRRRDRFYAWRRAQVGVWAVLLYGFRRWPNVQADHILRLASGGSNDLSNLQMLCIRHHARKTRTEGKPIRIRGIRRFRLRHGFAGLELLAAGLLALIRPHHVSPVPVVLGGLLAAGILVVLVLSRMRNRVLDRLWNADLIGLPKQPKQQGRKTDFIVPRSRGRGITGSGWHWQRIDGRKLPRYQPARLTLRYRGKYLPPEQQAKAVSTVSAMLGRPFRARWDHANDRAVLEPIPALPEQVDPFPHDGDPGSLTFAVSESGPVAWNVRGAGGAPHCLVVGETGLGKTSSLRVFIDQALQAGWEVHIGDPKQIELRNDRNRVASYETEIEDIGDLIINIKATMTDRYRQIKAALDVGNTPPQFRPLLLVVDEVAELIEELRKLMRNPPGGGKGSASEHPAVLDLFSIARLGRSARIHLLVGMQRPDARLLTGNARDQFGARLACGPMSADGARMMFGDGTTAKAVEHVPGRALWQVGSGEPVRLQVAWLPDTPATPVSASSPKTAA
jgi:5-methylcytosine-specific restriction endonuclease McrA